MLLAVPERDERVGDRSAARRRRRSARRRGLPSRSAATGSGMVGHRSTLGCDVRATVLRTVARFAYARLTSCRGTASLPTPAGLGDVAVPCAPMPEPPTTLAHPCPRADQALRRVHRGRRHRLRRRARRVVRVPRAERRRQDLDDADDRLRLAGHRRARCAVLGMDPARDGPRIRARLGVVPAAGHARHRADRPREPRHLRPLLRPAAGRGRAAAPTSCSSSPS